MIVKKATAPGLFKRFQKGVKIVIFLEIAAFIGSYGVWTRMNNDQDFRFYIHKNYPSLLEGFYEFGAIFDKDALVRLREIDLAAFEVKKSK